MRTEIKGLEELERYASRCRHDGNSINEMCAARYAGRTGEKRSETETDSKIVLHALVLIVGIQKVTALHCALNHTSSLKRFNTVHVGLELLLNV